MKKYQTEIYIKYFTLALFVGAISFTSAQAAQGDVIVPVLTDQSAVAYDILSSDSDSETFIAEKNPLACSSSDLIENLRKNQLIESMENFENLYPTSSANARKVVFIHPDPKSDMCSLAVKVFKNIEVFIEESEQIERDTQYMDEFNRVRKFCQSNLPIIVNTLAATMVENAKGEVEGVTILEMAKGNTIKYIMGNLSKYKAPQLASMFRNIGMQLGALDALFYSQQQKLFLHPDSHWENFIFEEETSQLYWIDTAGIATMELVPEQETPRLFWTGFMRNIAYKFVTTIREDAAKLVHEIESDPSDQNYMKLYKHLIIIKSLFEGYLTEMSIVGLEDATKQNYKSFFEKKEEFKLANGSLAEEESLLDGVNRVTMILDANQEGHNPAIVKGFNILKKGYPVLKKAS